MLCLSVSVTVIAQVTGCALLYEARRNVEVTSGQRVVGVCRRNISTSWFQFQPHSTHFLSGIEGNFECKRVIHCFSLRSLVGWSLLDLSP
ncbi:hypothetical protein BD410DRAFT_365985 [Rickenella mellea]|uniref:Secreted protein n=1 Tax=Rickenella mellea TaxID=50990 RepID=A0A4Y7PZE3_9AGAM|nr:hypothetical protein BD410DRAFT_365985 [Rickenella mellea]